MRERTRARGAIVVILGGAHGSGFSVQGTPDLIDTLPFMLRDIAAQIEADGAHS